MNFRIPQFLKKYDYSIFLTFIAIFVIGILNLHSATHADPNLATVNLYKAQIIWFILSLIVGILVSLISTSTIRKYSYILYAINISLLVMVFVIGKKALGAQRWLDLGFINIQPSELMKITLVMALARWFSNNSPNLPMDISRMFFPSIITLIPTALIICQPDLGTGLLLILIFSSMLLYRNLKVKSIIIILVVAILSGSLMYEFGLKDYQKKRIITFINPTHDAKGAGYNAIQSEIAIGSGKLVGKGYKKSSQASLQYLPENHTDFVFSIFNEEHGLLGSIILIILYIILFLRIIWLSISVLKIYDSILAIGLTSIIFWHTFVNMGMVMGLLPIVGIPLPFMSYGGSSLLTFGICGGLITNISNSKNLF